MGKTPERVVQLLQKEIPGKISRNKFCIQTGINQNSIDKYMAGITEPTTASLQKLAEYFGVSVSWLRGEVSTTLEQEMAYVAGWVKIREELHKEEGGADVLRAITLLGELRGWAFKKYRAVIYPFLQVPVEERDMVLDMLEAIKTEDLDESDFSDDPE